MKKFKMLGFIAIIVIIIDSVLYCTSNWHDISNSFKEGYNHADRIHSTEKTELPRNAETTTFHVYPINEEIVTDTLMNKRIGKYVPYKTTQIETVIIPPIWITFFILPMILVVPAFIYGFIGLIRLLISITRKDIFNPKNIWRIRWFAYSLFAYSFLGTLLEWCLGKNAISQIDLPGYELINYSSFTGEWSMVVTIILFAEIFATAVKIKEEQDLTI